MEQYDIIITGGGGAGLSLINQLCESPLKSKKILLIDKEDKAANDRTWCFWEAKDGPFNDIVYQSWDKLSFHSKEYSTDFNIAPYRYKMIRGIDFYRHVQKKVAAHPNIHVLKAKVEEVGSENDKAFVRANGKTYSADWCFNSILFQPIDKEQTNYLDQHFKGWIIKTDQPTFDPGAATLMDFRVPQQGESRFLYVLPLDEHRALVEVAIFSNELLSSAGYDGILTQYIANYITSDAYSVEHEEFGIIPMTDFPFSRADDRVIHFGTAGGDTKASTGYTFWRIQEYTQKVVALMAEEGHPYIKEPIFQKRFKLYDSTMLKVLVKDRLAGDELFTHLFKKNPPQRLLRFLNEETHLFEELALMSTVPTVLFLKTFIEEVTRKRLATAPNLP